MVVNAPDTIFTNTILEPATCPKASRAKEQGVPANSGWAHLSGANTDEAAVRQEEKGMELEQSINNLLVGRHEKQSRYPHGLEL